jgi:hypothetical protein
MDMQSRSEATAKELLRRILPESSWKQFSKTGKLEVTGTRGIYRICTDGLTRVLDVQTRRPRAGACLQLTVPAPAHDRVIAEYVLIQNDEDLYWQTANIFPANLDNRVFAEFLVAALDALLLILLIAQLHA